MVFCEKVGRLKGAGISGMVQTTKKCANREPSSRAMTKGEFETLLHEAGKLARDRDFILSGSQALRGVCATFPRDFPKTTAANLIPRHQPEALATLRAELGKESKFFKQYGCYLDSPDPAIMVLPNAWEKRLIPFRTPRTGGVTAWCLDPTDLFVCKLFVWETEDQQFARAMLKHKIATPKAVLNRIENMPILPLRQKKLRRLVEELVACCRTEWARFGRLP